VVGGVRDAAGDPVACVQVAVAAQLSDEFGIASLMGHSAGCLSVHGRMFGDSDLGKAVIADHLDAGRRIEQDRGVGQDQVVDGLLGLAEQCDGC
jgi:hypothetical protein